MQLAPTPNPRRCCARSAPLECVLSSTRAARAPSGSRSPPIPPSHTPTDGSNAAVDLIVPCSLLNPPRAILGAIRGEVVLGYALLNLSSLRVTWLPIIRTLLLRYEQDALHRARARLTRLPLTPTPLRVLLPLCLVSSTALRRRLYAARVGLPFRRELAIRGSEQIGARHCCS